jgi:hypothetical protein
MREIRPSGSEGGVALITPSLPLSLVNHTVGRVLDLFGIENELLKRWGEHPL